MAIPAPTLLASGRAADVFEHDAGTVIRRYRDPRADTTREAALMEHVRLKGFPAPAVHYSSGPELVMDRIDGPTMLDDIIRRPWRILAHARLLASLHERLHAIEPPRELEAPYGEGPAVLHLDLHPANVILGAHGPVVIDWTGAVRGDPALDLAQTWVVMATAAVPGSPVARTVGAVGRGSFLRAFLRQVLGAP